MENLSHSHTSVQHASLSPVRSFPLIADCYRQSALGCTSAFSVQILPWLRLSSTANKFPAVHFIISSSTQHP
ncbi:hypothetical protein ABO04_11815 [Nitrosomonas sp. HPC101]|nr:hypothetical protein [Nitrosomonas sp. HPC101]